MTCEHCMKFKYQCINNASLEDSHDYHAYYLGCFGAMEAELSSCDRDLYGSQHLKSLQLLWKKFAESPGLEPSLPVFIFAYHLNHS